MPLQIILNTVQFCTQSALNAKHFVKTYLTTFLQIVLNSFKVNMFPRKRWRRAKKASTSSVLPARGCSSCPMSRDSLLLNSILSTFVVIAITVSLENPQIPLKGLKCKGKFQISVHILTKKLIIYRKCTRATVSCYICTVLVSL